MAFISPMLAAAMPKTPLTITPGVFVAERKWDGHRLVVEVQHDDSLDAQGLLAGTRVTAWSRDGLVRLLPDHLLTALREFPSGVYDGELVSPEEKCHGVTELVNRPRLAFVVFDVLELLGHSVTREAYDTRRVYLTTIFEKVNPFHEATPVRLSLATAVNSREDVDALLEDVFAIGGEGLILKRRTAPYVAGKRPKDAWVKLKRKQTAVLTLIGFKPSKGEVNDRGPYARVVLRDADGYETSVKTLNDAELAAFNVEGYFSEASTFMTPHPALGRRLRIEFTERTKAGEYREPRWDRWAEEGE